ncbi:MAG: DUF1722 domain-containing protein [Proteobacteria bacterium]|nr:DUF1722 domain-containing protein [Pseudomonadota bacterium]MBU1737062.1 DUF1722 domain-containing protein [Pseudomonadota bacterium]
MRVWDIHPGYLNRQSLLGEHRELHGIVSILSNNKKGYSRHPETLRWQGYGWALRQRHAMLAAEMALRGYVDRTPVALRSKKGVWPETYIDQPGAQLALLAGKYVERGEGRIPLPANAQQLWAQHKYSVMARDPGIYKSIGGRVAARGGNSEVAAVALVLTELLRQPPNRRYIKNTLQHMWGYVSQWSGVEGRKIEGLTPHRLLAEIRRAAFAGKVLYLVHSTALSDLAAWKY